MSELPDKPELRKEPPSPRQAALWYAKRGWSVIPVPFQEKNPGIKGWERLRITPETVSEHFNCRPMNIGVLMGEPSGNLIDIDLDHPLAVELAPKYLPHTSAVFGRDGNPKSHWIYQGTSEAKTKKFKSKTAGMIVEMRSTGLQTIFPPSRHVSGELISWHQIPFPPAEIDPDKLLLCVMMLFDAVREALGEKATPKLRRAVSRPKSKSAPAPSSAGPPPPAADAPPSEPDDPLEESAPAEAVALEVGVRANRCLAAMLRLQMSDHNDGSSRLYACACRVVEHDLPDDLALSIFRQYAAQRPFPKDWSAADVLRRIRDAELVCQRGAAFVPDTDDDGLIRLGTRDPESGKLVLSAKKTLPTAEAFVAEFHTHEGERTLHTYADILHAWQNGRYEQVEELKLKQRLHEWLHAALRYGIDPESKELTLIPFDSNPGTVKAALETIRSFVFLPVTTPVPSWLGDAAGLPPAHEILPCQSLLVHLPTMERLSVTPTFFTTNSLEFDHDPDAPVPDAWFRFLHQLFEGDEEALNLLQEWAGYLLTADTSLQKMLLIVGPKRGGKGTIARVLAKLIGEGNVCGPTTSSLAGPFGLQPLIGKSLAIVSDARFSGESIATVVERLLCISGEDNLTIDRKYLESLTMKLPTRFMFLTNELPRLNDASGALAGRFLIIRLHNTFYGREDHGLTGKLLAELPGILNWAIEGRQRLHSRGHFVQPSSVEDAVQEIEDLSSPVGAFVRDWCLVKAGQRVLVDDLYGAWTRWCDLEGREKVSNKQMFGRDLMAAVPGIVRRRGTGMHPFYEGISVRESTP